MFTLDTRVADALKERPELIDLLPAFHPAFEKLRHPILGRVLPKLVTLGDAARIAGVDPQALLDVANLPGPPSTPPPRVAPTEEPPPPWLERAPRRTLDVRPVLDAGGEPFAEIMRSIRTLPTGRILTVVAPFEPAPLVRLLGDRGWSHHVRWRDDGACEAHFWRDDAPLAAPDDDPVRLDDRLVDGVLDVRGLPPPQPLRTVLAALDAGHLPLVVVHEREPALLFPRLADRGLAWTVTRRGDVVEIRIDAA